MREAEVNVLEVVLFGPFNYKSSFGHLNILTLFALP